MGITLLGVITILVSIYAFFKNKKLLLYIMVFLSTFTAAELLHINITTTPIQTFEFTGAMWLLRELIDFLKTKPKFDKEKIINKFKENKLGTAFVIFIGVILLSEVIFAISGLTLDYIGIKGDPEVLKFSSKNITQPVIVIFVFIIATVLSFKIKTKDEVKELLKVFFISTIFAIVWGFIQFIIFYFGIPYPAFLFNNNIYVEQLYDQVVNNVKRISSIALEPSMFAINLMCFIPFALGAFLKIQGKIKEKKYLLAFIVLVLATACAILTAASTTIVGLIVVNGLFGIYILFGFIKKGELDNRKSNFCKMAIVTAASIAIAGSLCVVSIKVGYKLRND